MHLKLYKMANKPIILMMGGSLGSVKINNCLRSVIKDITKDFQLVHICGKGNIDTSLENLEG
ncbi:MAG: glycosyltransferase, partial [Anaerotignaceae bacterium]